MNPHLAAITLCRMIEMSQGKNSESSKFVKRLASNDRITREKAFEALSKFLSSKSSSNLSLLELEKLWKGMYFSMWFSDRPGPQQRLAESLGGLFSEGVDIGMHARFVEAFWVVLSKEWPHIDQWRIDKFYLLIRRVLRHNFIKLKRSDWDSKYIKEFCEVLEKIPLSGNKEVSVSLPYHLCDIFIDELELVMFEDFYDEEEENEDSDLEEIKQKKLERASQVPILLLISPFDKLSKEASLKTLRQKCKDEVLDDKRIKDWRAVCNQSEDDNNGDCGNLESEDESDDEWTGFN